MLLDWITSQSGTVGFLTLAIGMVYAFYGFRFFKPLLALTCAGVGWLIGAVIAINADMSPELLAALASLAGGITAFRFQRASMALASAAVWGVLGIYLADQARLDAVWQFGAAVLCGGLGLLFAWVCQRSMTLVLTTLQGAVLMVLGVAGFTATFAPSLGYTFVSWASDWSLLVPALLAALVATAYSHQSMHQQGDTISGV